MKHLLLAVLVALCTPAYAEIYKWVDADGRTHFGDKPPKNQTSEEIEVTVNTYTSVSYDMSVFDTLGTLVIYTRDECKYCNQAKDFMRSNGIAFDERNLDHSRTARIQYKRLKATGVPVFLKGTQRMNGYREERLVSFIEENSQKAAGK